MRTAGIQDIVSYLPAYTVGTGEVRDYWTRARDQGRRGSGQACCNHDEDALTLAAVAAGRLEQEDAPKALFLASTSLPYAEKLNAVLLAAILGWEGDLLALDVTGSSRSGVDALGLAVDVVSSRGGTATVVAGDCRTAWPGSDLEPQLGDGAAALRVGTEGLIATVEGVTTLAAEFTDVWRLNGDPFLRSGDARFNLQNGYLEPMGTALRRLLEHHQLAPERIRAVALAAPNAGAYLSLLKSVGLPPEASLGPDLWQEAGDLGAPAPFLLLESALRRSAPGDFILLGAHGSGATILLLQVQDRVRVFQQRPTRTLRPMPLSYAHKLLYRRAISTEPVVPFSSVTQTWREQSYNLPLCGRRCRKCGSIEFPVQRACRNCRSLEPFERVRLSRRGTIFTHTVDHLFPSLGGPVVMVVVDLDGGGRVFTQMTDCVPEEVAVGGRVEMVLRRLHEGGAFVNYFWKARPLPGGED